MAHPLAPRNLMNRCSSIARDVFGTDKTIAEEGLQGKGDGPTVLPSLTQCMYDFNLASLHITREYREYRYPTISGPYPPSVASLENLKQTMIKDLKLETHHRGHYLLIRFVCQALHWGPVMNVVEDENGNGVQFSLYYPNPSMVGGFQNMLRAESVIILKEPYFKLGTNGKYEIRVDHYTDMVRLTDDDSRIPDQWKKPSLDDPISAVSRGADFGRKGDILQAIAAFSMGLRSCLNPALTRHLYMCRAFGNMGYGAFDATLCDVSLTINPKERTIAELYFGSLALCRLRRFEEALELQEIIVETFPDHRLGRDLQHGLEQTRLRISEQENGVYDFNTMYGVANTKTPLIERGTFTGPVEIRESKGRGRGLFTTRRVKVGDLLLCEKAFYYCRAAPRGEKTKAASQSLSVSTELVNIPQEVITRETQVVLLSMIVSKLVLNPSLQPSFEDLVHGEYEGVKGSSVDGAPVVDTFLIADTIQRNGIECPMTSRETIRDAELNRISKYKLGSQPASGGNRRTAGVWILASYINHSCDPNCTRTFIGDMQIVRAARDIPADVELTFSYVIPDDFAKMANVGAWGFHCYCSICVADHATSYGVKAQRIKLRETFSSQNTTVERRKKILEQFRSTYAQPPSEVPRLQMFPMHQSMIEQVRFGAPEVLISHLLAALESLGFIIELEGTQNWLSPNPRITVRRWGFPHRGVTLVWVMLRNVYKAQGRNTLSEQVHEFARISYMLLVGEDATFA